MNREGASLLHSDVVGYLFADRAESPLSDGLKRRPHHPAELDASFGLQPQGETKSGAVVLIHGG